ncbi:hypothetical protein BO221_40155 [Archangium sp. Cb G35]|nr:hypothetical protein BO221_40155 [Archangium sp. Cb G35]
MALIGAAGIISGCALEQPSAGCIVQDSTDYPWQAVYVLKSGDATKSCGQLKGEALGVWKYVQFTKDEQTQQLTKVGSKLALRPQGLADRFLPYVYEDEALNADGSVKVDEDGNPVMEEKEVDRVEGARADDYKIAKASTALSETLADEPDDKGLCATTGFNSASVTSKAVTRTVEESGETITVVPEETLSYTFTDVKVYSDPSAPGTQLTGTLKYADPECEAEYQVLALWPQVECDVEAFNNPTEANAADRCDVGSGLNPDFDAVCVDGIGPGGAAACVPNPATGVPAFKNK